MQFLPHSLGAWLWLGLRLIIFFGLLGALAAYAVAMPGKSFVGALTPLSDAEQTIRDNLRRHVAKLAAEIGPRNVSHYANLNAAADYIAGALSASGFQVRRQEYEVAGKTVANLEVEIPGAKAPGEIVVIGAHYDSVEDCPGANDNASGVAALLELARLLKGRQFDRTVRLVAFVNEEPPYFFTSNMGSRVYARRSQERGEKITNMLSLETIGCYADASGSQRLPPGFGLFFPDRGNFIGFIGNLGSRQLVRQCLGVFRGGTQFPSEGIAAPAWVAGVSWSDQQSFWREGYPALMVTDTAPYRYRFYHTPDDTPDKIDYDRTARVTAGLERVIAALSSEGSDFHAKAQRCKVENK